MADFHQLLHTIREKSKEFTGRLAEWGRTRWRQRPTWKQVMKYAGITAAAGAFLAFLFCLAVYLGVFGSIPNYAQLQGIKNYTASEVYAGDGQLLGKYYIENRINADFEEISPTLIYALVATEDARFFEHNGIDIRAFFRVLVKSILLSDDSSGGGSTISQQLAKNLFPRRNHGIFTIPAAKVSEMIIARRLEKIYTKNELLNLYLNTVPFGENVFGIKVASRRFFNKAPEDLKTEEAAVLVGMLKGNTYYNPVRNPERALQRRNTVLGQMAKYAYLDSAEADSLQQLPLEVDYRRDGSNQGLATYFREHLRHELEEILGDYKKPDGSTYNLYTDGLKIYTTIDARLQQYAEEAVREHMSRLQEAFNKHWGDRPAWGSDRVLQRAVEDSKRYQQLKESGRSEEELQEAFNTPQTMVVFDWQEGDVQKEMTPLDSIKHYLTTLNTGFLAMEPGTGLLRAWVGGVDHQYFKYDHVKSSRQVGSTFKPVVYATALTNGMLPCEYTQNELVTYTEYDDWTPRNADGEYGGVYSMEGALSHSVNAVTVGILERSSIDSVRLLAREMGISSGIPAVPAIALGSVEASLWEMVRVYGTFANRGLRPEMHYLDRIETSDGKLLVEFNRPSTGRFPRVLREDHADMMVKMLESVVDSGTARRLQYEFRLYNDIAGKTGTTQDHTDGWFIGFTPKLVAGAWVGADNPSVHFRSMRLGQGSNTALPIWGLFMQKVYKDPSYRHWKRAEFAEPNDTTWALMQCPPFLEEMPIVAEYEEDYQENPEFFNRLYSDLAAYRDQAVNIQLKRRRSNETEAEYYERMRRYNERLMRRDDRREQLKQFWKEKLFGGGDKDGG